MLRMMIVFEFEFFIFTHHLKRLRMKVVSRERSVGSLLLKVCKKEYSIQGGFTKILLSNVYCKGSVTTWICTSYVSRKHWSWFLYGSVYGLETSVRRKEYDPIQTAMRYGMRSRRLGFHLSMRRC